MLKTLLWRRISRKFHDHGLVVRHQLDLWWSDRRHWCLSRAQAMISVHEWSTASLPKIHDFGFFSEPGKPWCPKWRLIDVPPMKSLKKTCLYLRNTSFDLASGAFKSILCNIHTVVCIQLITIVYMCQDDWASQKLAHIPLVLWELSPNGSDGSGVLSRACQM